MHKHKCEKCGKIWVCKRPNMCDSTRTSDGINTCLNHQDRGGTCNNDTRYCPIAQEKCSHQYESYCKKCFDKIVHDLPDDCNNLEGRFNFKNSYVQVDGTLERVRGRNAYT